MRSRCVEKRATNITEIEGWPRSIPEKKKFVLIDTAAQRTFSSLGLGNIYHNQRRIRSASRSHTRSSASAAFFESAMSRLALSPTVKEFSPWMRIPFHVLFYFKNSDFLLNIEEGVSWFRMVLHRVPGFQTYSLLVDDYVCSMVCRQTLKTMRVRDLLKLLKRALKDGLFMVYEILGHCDLDNLNSLLRGKRKSRDDKLEKKNYVIKLKGEPIYLILVADFKKNDDIWTENERDYLYDGMEQGLDAEGMLSSFPFKKGRNVSELQSKIYYTQFGTKKRKTRDKTKRKKAPNPICHKRRVETYPVKEKVKDDYQYVNAIGKYKSEEPKSQYNTRASQSRSFLRRKRNALPMRPPKSKPEEPSIPKSTKRKLRSRSCRAKVERGNMRQKAKKKAKMKKRSAKKKNKVQRLETKLDEERVALSLVRKIRGNSHRRIFAWTVGRSHVDLGELGEELVM